MMAFFIPEKLLATADELIQQRYLTAALHHFFWPRVRSGSMLLKKSLVIMGES